MGEAMRSKQMYKDNTYKIYVQIVRLIMIMMCQGNAKQYFIKIGQI